MNDKKYYCECGNLLEKEIEPDVKPDGSILGYAVWECNKCGMYYEKEELNALTK